MTFKVVGNLNQLFASYENNVTGNVAHAAIISWVLNRDHYCKVSFDKKAKNYLEVFNVLDIETSAPVKDHFCVTTDDFKTFSFIPASEFNNSFTPSHV